MLDVVFREDDSRIQRDHHNLTILRHIALNLLRQEASSKHGVKARRKRAAWDHDDLLKVLEI